MKKTRNRVNLVISYPYSKKFFLLAVLLVFIMSTTATVTVGYGLQSRAKLALGTPSPSPEAEKLAAAPSSDPSVKPTTRPTSKPQVTPSPTPTQTPSSDPTPSPENRDPQSTTNTPTPTPTSQPSPSPSPSPEPTPTPNPGEGPPVMEITYPSEGVTIVIGIGSDTPLCIVEEVRGGNTAGLQRKYSFNGQTWTEYAGMNQLCLDSQIGLNNIKTKYRNEAGEESAEYTRTFIVIL